MGVSTSGPDLADLLGVGQAEPKLAVYFLSDAYKLPCNNPGASPYFF